MLEKLLHPINQFSLAIPKRRLKIGPNPGNDKNLSPKDMEIKEQNLKITQAK